MAISEDIRRNSAIASADLVDSLLDLAVKSLEDDKGEEITIINLSGKTSMADYMIVATGRSSRQVCAMAEHIYEKLKQAGAVRLALEGIPRGDWVLIDAGDIVVHIFKPEIRAYYNLEKMWMGPQPVIAEQMTTSIPVM